MLNDIESIVEQERFVKLPISLTHVELAGQLPDHHKDPFDRMLVAQARAEKLTILTADDKIQRYDAAVMMATVWFLFRKYCSFLLPVSFPPSGRFKQA